MQTKVYCNTNGYLLCSGHFMIIDALNVLQYVMHVMQQEYVCTNDRQFMWLWLGAVQLRHGLNICRSHAEKEGRPVRGKGPNVKIKGPKTSTDRTGSYDGSGDSG